MGYIIYMIYIYNISVSVYNQRLDNDNMIWMDVD